MVFCDSDRSCHDEERVNGPERMNLVKQRIARAYIVMIFHSYIGITQINDKKTLLSEHRIH